MGQEGLTVRTPIRYFVVNDKTGIMHIFGFCPHTKKRNIPIRLFDTPQELREHAGRELRLCSVCQREYDQMK